MRRSHARAVSSEDEPARSPPPDDDDDAAATLTSPSRVQLGKGFLHITLGLATLCAPYVVPHTGAHRSLARVRVAHAAEAPAAPADILPAPIAGNHPKTTARELTPRLRDFLAWLEGVKKECTKRGISADTIATVFKDLEPLPEVVVQKTSGDQPEVKFTVERYLKNIVTRDRIEMGAERLIEHAALLREVELEYGVPAEILVSIWGIESSFGGFTGDMDSIQALATLGWEQQFDNYFRNELIEAVRIIDQGHVKVGQLRGSWAGALGQCQFMPSNFHAYAVDKDGDGRADIWKSLPDVFASMGNFISTYCGWNPKVRAAGYRVEIDRTNGVVSLPKEVIGGYWGDRKKPRPARYFLWNGVKPVHKETRLPWSAETMLLMPDGEDGPAFLAMCNFQAIMRYNPSTSYAMAVSTLAQEIVDEAAAMKEAKRGRQTYGLT